MIAFRERYPEHQNFDGDRDPALVLLLFCLLVNVAAWQLYGLWRLFDFWVKSVLCYPFRMCCRCGRYSRHCLNGDWQNGDEMMHITVRFEKGVGHGDLRLGDGSVVAMMHGGKETLGKFTNGRLKWETGEM